MFTHRVSDLKTVQQLSDKSQYNQACMSILAAPTPSSHTKNPATKICSKGWVAQAPFFDRS